MKFLLLTLSLLLVYLSISAVSGYTVNGNKIYDPTGKPVLIRGVDRPSFEWSATGQYASANDYALMQQWGANVVRIATNQQFWLTTAGYPATIDQQIAWATSVGMGVILDLHWNDVNGQQNMADRTSITFWSQVAARYKNNPWVMFELYNEPHDISWSQWLNGDSQYAGMQEMYNAVRAAGASNVCIVGGLNWAFDLSGVGQGYAVTGQHIAYATHPYDYDGKQAANWDAAFGYLAATSPVIMTEFGQYCSQDTYVADLLVYAQQKNLHWTAWAWWVGGCSFPSIISDWNGTPIDGAGVLVKSYLSGNAPTTPVIPTSAPTSGSTSGSGSGSGSASSALTVYTDALASGWQDWSWSTSYSLSDTTIAHSGSKSIKFQVTSYQAIYLHSTSTFAVSSYSTLQFYINGGSTAQNVNALGVQLYDASTNAFGQIVSVPPVPANQWILVTIPVTSFGVQSALVSGFVIKAMGSASTGYVWIDDISFVPASSSTPAPTGAPSAPTSNPTSLPTQKATPAPTQKATAAPTQKATAAPTQKATPAPTQKATAAPTQKATAAPTQKATAAPTQKATAAPTQKATSAPSSGCDASSIQITQTSAGTWPSGNTEVTQYNVEIRTTCTTKKLVGLTLSATNWNPINSWSLVPSSNNGATTISLPAYASISQSTVFSAGYQNIGTQQASFTITSYTFQ